MIDDIIEGLKVDYDVNLQSEIPLLGGMTQYIMSVTTKPLYTREHYRMYSNKQMTEMEKK